jgi:DNA-binding transcriptional MerR regulator
MLIGELSRRTEVSPRLLRYYGEQGLLPSKRNSNGYRVYGEDAVIRVCQIRRLLAAGLTTEVIGGALDCVNGPEARLDPCPQLVSLLHGELAAMDERIDAMRRQRGSLARYLGQA